MTFQRLGLEEFARAYLDDLVVICKTFEEQLAHIQTVLEKLPDSAFTAMARKCQFGMYTLDMLRIDEQAGGSRVI